MDLQTSIRVCFNKYATFQGRASRSEYWFFVLFQILAVIGGLILDAILGTSALFYALVVLGTLLPALSVMVRRLHDTGRSGWWYWISLVPLVGIILIIVWLCQVGTSGENVYGQDPLA